MTTSTTAAGRRPSTRWWALAGGLVGAGGLGYLATHDPNEAGHYPGCFLLATTGLYCPACGGTRATYALLHGDVATSLAMHPLVLPLAVLAALGIGWVLLRRRGLPLPALRVPDRAIVAAFVLVLAFGVLRNLPGLELLAPV